MIVGKVTSSKIYNSLKLGIAIANNTKAGKIVHNTSMIVPCTIFFNVILQACFLYIFLPMFKILVILV